MTLKRIEQITVYETNDGEITVYCGKENKQFTVINGEQAKQWLLWLDILAATDGNESLRLAVDHAETIFYLVSTKNQ